MLVDVVQRVTCRKRLSNVFAFLLRRLGAEPRP